MAMGDSHKDKNEMAETKVHEVETNKDESASNLETNEVDLNLHSSNSQEGSHGNNEKSEATNRENNPFQSQIQHLFSHLDEITKYDDNNCTTKGGDADKPNSQENNKTYEANQSFKETNKNSDGDDKSYRLCSHTFSNPAKVPLDTKTDSQESTDIEEDARASEKYSSDSSSNSTTLSVSLSLSLNDSCHCISDITTSDFTLSDLEEEANDQNEESSTPGKLKDSLADLENNEDNSSTVENKTTDPALDKEIANLDSDKQNDSLSLSTNNSRKRNLSPNPKNNYSNTDKDSMHIVKKLKTINNNNDVDNSNNSIGSNAGKTITTLYRDVQNNTEESLEDISSISSNVKLDEQCPNSHSEAILSPNEQKYIEPRFQDQNTDSNNKIIEESKEKENSSLDLQNNSSPKIILEEDPCGTLDVENPNNSIELSEISEEDSFVNLNFDADDVETIVVDVDVYVPNGTSDDQYASNESSDREMPGANRRVRGNMADEMFYRNYAYNSATYEHINMDDEDEIVPSSDENEEDNQLIFSYGFHNFLDFESARQNVFLETSFSSFDDELDTTLETSMENEFSDFE